MSRAIPILFVVAVIVLFIVVRMRRASKGPTEARMAEEQETGRGTLYADLPLAIMMPLSLAAEPPAEPWSHFQSVAWHLRAKDRTLAFEDLHRITADPVAKPSVQLLAWRFLRELGEQPDAQTADAIQGVIIEIPIRNNRDVQVIYRDGSMKGLTAFGKWTGGNASGDSATAELMNAAQATRPLLPLSPSRPPQTPILPRVGILTFHGVYVLDLDPKLIDTSSEPPYTLFRAAQKIGLK